MYSKFSFITVNGGLTISFIVNIFLVSSLFSNVLYTENIVKAQADAPTDTVFTYEHTFDTAIEGDFIIEIVNNCPTNSAKKDRVSIWNLSWMSAPLASTEENA